MSLPSQLPSAQWPETWPSYPSVVRLARGIVGRSGDAEGLAHAAMERGLRSGQRGSSLGLGWFAAVMRNVRRDAHRRARSPLLALIQDDVRDPVLVSGDPTPAEHSIRRESAAMLLTAVDGLPTRRCDIVRLRYLEGLTAEEVAVQMSVSLSTVERESRRALDGLARDLGPDERGGRLEFGLAGMVGGDRSRAFWSAEPWSVVGAVLAVVVPLALVIGVLMSGTDRNPNAADTPLRATPGAMPGVDVGPTGPASPDGQPSRLEASDGEDRGGSVEGAPTAPGGTPLIPLEPAAPSTHPFSVTLIVDGEPAGPHWRSMNPRWEPDTILGGGDDRPRCPSYDKNPTDGRFEIEVPDRQGVWLFRYVNDVTKEVVYLLDEGLEGAPRTVVFSTGSIELDRRAGGAVAELEAGRHVVCCNVEPGCWVVSTLRPVEDQPDLLRVKSAALGTNWCADVKGSYVPDAWPRVGPAVVTPTPGPR